MADFFKSVFFFTIFIQYFLFLTIPYVVSVHFDVSSFSPDETSSSSSIVLYQGDAVASVGAIEFNDVAYLCHVGQAIYAKKVPMWDSDSGKVADFATHFTFIIDTQNRSTYGHGLAFFLAPPGFQIPPNSAGGFLGLFNTTNSASPQNHMVVVEFDSFSNPEWDPSFEHVGINNNSISSSVVSPWNVTLHSGQTTDAWVIYNATTKNLSVFWNYGGGSPNSTLSYIIDLKEVLTEWVTVGFSAATGQNVERHVLRSWAFSSSLDKKEEQSHKTAVRKIGLWVGLSASGILLIAVAGGTIILRFVILRKQKQSSKDIPDTEAATNLTSMNYDLERRAGPRKFSYKDLATATNNFSNERKLGEGGFGDVYKGYLIDLDMAVAVKKISRGSKQGKKEYVTEVKIISSLRHRNLVQLIGWCHDQGEFLLVYEFMPNGSLDTHLFGNPKKNPVPILSWALRYKITLGLASALLYLHEEWEQCVIHRDIKSSNIMLDSNFNVKLGDFGLARLMDHELGPQTTGLAGTLGYMAPEYVRTGRASKESDVYSFGVVALEIVCGRKSSDVIILTEEDDSGTGLVECVWNWYGKGQILSVVDQRLGTEFNPQQVECLVMVGLWCAHPDRNLRPSIRQAIQVLYFEAGFPDLPGKFPIPIYHHRTISPPGVSSSGDPLISCTSMNEGR